MGGNTTFVNRYRRALVMTSAILVAVMSVCASGGATITTSEEEPGTELALDESYDAVRNGARLFLTYDAQRHSFNGFAENTTDYTLKQVRVEVHLSNGVELDPTTPTDLKPGERIGISLEAMNKDFDGWTADPEIGESGGGHNE